MDATLECSNRDIAVARTLHEEIRKVLKAHERGERDETMLRDIKVLCSCILQTIHDPYCREKMCEVEIHSDELFAVDKRPRCDRSTQPGSMFLRRLVFKSLEAFDDGLRSLETMRQSAGDTSATHAAAQIAL